ncbi:MAG: hypothetical protein CTY16_02580 [Methylobacter sp.]|nr:MAG: hypothetical protein CTY16_02580 [Methylobacter sp.]
MTITTQLDEQSEQNLLFISQTTGETVAQIIQTLIAERAAQLREGKQPKSKMQRLLESDFVGCAEGPKDGSVNYKKYIADYLDEKYPNR